MSDATPDMAATPDAPGSLGAPGTRGGPGAPGGLGTPATSGAPGAPAPTAAGDAPEHDASQRRLAPDALKALTHPLRTRMWDYLRDHGSATATELAKAMGESTGQTSYHLRQLERFGFIEDDPERPAARERWWRPVGFQVTPEDLLDERMREDALTLLRARLAGRTAFVLRWIERHREEPREWLDASTSVETSVAMTAAELSAFTDDLEQLVRRHMTAAKDARGDGAPRRRVRLYLDVLPVPPQDGEV